MYVCGVTVYNEAHVGHAMSALVFDIIRRYLEYRGYEVRHVMNYTDVDDKIIARANELKEDPFKLAQRYINDYAQNLRDLNILPATSNPRATQTMDKILAMVQGLVEKGFAYAAPNGDVYFRVTKDKQYGKLSGRKLEDMQAGARIEVGRGQGTPDGFRAVEGRQARRAGLGFSPGARAGPGWHIECSAMNLAELGEQIDIHGGGNDLIFPHHENEIAQSEVVHRQALSPATGCTTACCSWPARRCPSRWATSSAFANSLSKRDADVMRMLVLSGSYRAPLLFNEETLDAAEKNVARLQSGLRPAGSGAAGLSSEAAAGVRQSGRGDAQRHSWRRWTTISTRRWRWRPCPTWSSRSTRRATRAPPTNN